MEQTIQRLTEEICGILAGSSPSIYLYGSAVLDDFRLGWSDIDILVLTRESIAPRQAARLVELRQQMQERDPGNPYYRSFEGGMLSFSAFRDNARDTVVYWGTSGQRVTDHYRFDSFSMLELLEHGRLLAGEDLREQLHRPAFADLRRDVDLHYATVRRYAATTTRGLYAFGWLLDIARCLYTLQTGEIAAKTAAGRWALDQGICPVEEALRRALAVREDPMKYKDDEETMAYSETLGPAIQRFADVLECELKESSMTTVYFVRHAQSDHSVHDDHTRPLTAKGLADTELVADFLRARGIEALYSSPYRRSVDTLGKYAEESGLPVEPVEDFRERRVDDGWIEDFLDFTRRQWEDPEYHLGGGESLHQVQARNIRALEELLVRHPGGTLAVGSHGMALSTIVNYYQPEFDFSGFQKILSLMPWIVEFHFENGNCVEIVSHDLFTGTAEKLL